MRKPKRKFPIVLSDGTEVQTMEELREKFDFKKVMEYFQNRRLAVWLEDRFYSDEADALKTIRGSDKGAPRKVCEILGVDYEEYAEELDDPETLAWRQERRERLKEFTDDEEIIKRVDYVAFDQDDLEDILRETPQPKKVWLCGNFFLFPSGMLRKNDITYIGIGKNVSVKIETKKDIDFSEQGIFFKNVKFVNDESEIVEEEEVPEEVVEEESEPVVELPPTKKLLEVKTVDPAFIPASAVVQTALRFKSKLRVRFDGKTWDAKSVDILESRGLLKGTKITIIAEGFDAEEAMAAFINLIEHGVRKNSRYL